MMAKWFIQFQNRKAENISSEPDSRRESLEVPLTDCKVLVYLWSSFKIVMMRRYRKIFFQIVAMEVSRRGSEDHTIRFLRCRIRGTAATTSLESDIRDTDPGGQVCCVILTQMENALCVAGVGSRLADDPVVECDNNGRSPISLQHTQLRGTMACRNAGCSPFWGTETSAAGWVGFRHRENG